MSVRFVIDLRSPICHQFGHQAVCYKRPTPLRRWAHLCEGKLHISIALEPAGLQQIVMLLGCCCWCCAASALLWSAGESGLVSMFGHGGKVSLCESSPVDVGAQRCATPAELDQRQVERPCLRRSGGVLDRLVATTERGRPAKGEGKSSALEGLVEGLGGF